MAKNLQLKLKAVEKVFLKNSEYSQENTYVGVFFNKVSGLRACCEYC